MLTEILLEIEKELPNLLTTISGWQSLNIDYDTPHVERLYREIDGYRVCLHRIHPCEKALFHPHPWASAVKILSGSYEMGVGYGGGSSPPPEAAKLILTAGSLYEMMDTNGWHWVRPIGEPSLSLMVMDKPRVMKHPGTKQPNCKMRELSIGGAMILLQEFRNLYAQEPDLKDRVIEDLSKQLEASDRVFKMIDHLYDEYSLATGLKR